MAEGTARSIDPFSFHVNSFELNRDVAKAWKDQDRTMIQSLLPSNQQIVDFDVLIVVKNFHACVLCTPTNIKGNRDASLLLASELQKDRDLIRSNGVGGISWKFELCFDLQSIPTYKINYCIVDRLATEKKPDRRVYTIGHYTGSSPVGLQFAAIRAGFDRYNVIMQDCTEFAKRFCYELLSYCNNGFDIDRDVESRLNKVTSTGSSLEMGSRRVASSGWIANISLGGTTVASWFADRRGIPLVLLLLVGLLYPFAISYAVFKLA